MTYDGYNHILVVLHEGVATVTLNRPELRNAASIDVHLELEEIWHKIARDEDVRCVILTGAGKAFSAGGDINKMKERIGTPQGLQHCLRAPGHTRRLWEALLTIEQPVIAAINGDAIGLGSNMALFCDITVIAEDAKIGDSHVKMGMVAGDGGAVIYPLLLGMNKAKDFLLRGRIVNGREAVDVGLVNYAVPKEDVLAEARKIAEELAALPTWALRWTKLAVNKPLREQMNLVFDVAMPYEMMTMQNDDFAEAVNAFVEKRKPDFKGT